MKIAIEMIKELALTANCPIKFSELCQILGTKTSRGSASQVAAAFRAAKRDGDNFLCGLIARTFVNKKGHKAW